MVDSLEAVLIEAGLEMRGLTLEPIAALEAVIPPTMRHLNLTLVDIGAGTSDIAFTGDGTVRAFAMVPQAGDAVTEAVSRRVSARFCGGRTGQASSGIRGNRACGKRPGGSH